MEDFLSFLFPASVINASALPLGPDPVARLLSALSLVTSVAVLPPTSAGVILDGQDSLAPHVCFSCVLITASRTVTCPTGYCGANGVCSGPNTCSCNVGWSETTCQTRLCSHLPFELSLQRSALQPVSTAARARPPTSAPARRSFPDPHALQVGL
jgi:hypothetical protein